MRVLPPLILVLTLAGCASIDLPFGPFGGSSDAAPRELEPLPEGIVRPRSRDDARAKPPENARTVEEFDTTTASERAEAASGGTVGRSLGMTVISLGSPAEPGFWLKTSLVTEAGPGRVYYAATDKSVKVDLIPVEDGGSRLSLPAMRLIGAPLTGLPEVEVFAE